LAAVTPNRSQQELQQPLMRIAPKESAEDAFDRRLARQPKFAAAIGFAGGLA
jgi:hypothetical protein